jgi:hypothetical protein
VSDDPLVYLRATHAAVQAEAEAARDIDYAQCGVWEARGPYPSASGEADGVSRPRGNLRAQIGRDDIFLDAELPWGLIPHMARHDPAAVLRRITADKKLIAAHPVTTEVRDIRMTRFGCQTCHKWDDRVEGRGYCDTILALAEGWGWTEETT